MTVPLCARLRTLPSHGAALAVIGVLLAATSLVASTSAAPNTSPAVLTPITPCRLMDTRSTSQVGPKGNPLTAGLSYTTAGRGNPVGTCNIPSTATALLVNVTAVNGTAKSYLTLYPDDVSRPTASNVNWVAGQGATPNSATIALGGTGQFSIYNDAGTVNVIIDVSGYYQTEAVAGGPRAYGHLSATDVMTDSKNVLSFSHNGTGDHCVQLDPSIAALTAIVTITMDYAGDETNSARMQFSEVLAGGCGANGIRIITSTYNYGATSSTYSEGAFYFTVA